MYNMPAGLGTCRGKLVQQSAGFALQGLGLMLLADLVTGAADINLMGSCAGCALW